MGLFNRNESVSMAEARSKVIGASGEARTQRLRSLEKGMGQIKGELSAHENLEKIIKALEDKIAAAKQRKAGIDAALVKEREDVQKDLGVVQQKRRELELAEQSLKTDQADVARLGKSSGDLGHYISDEEAKVKSLRAAANSYSKPTHT